MEASTSTSTAILHMFQGMDDLPKLTTRTFIGILVAITGNVLISLALNLQKLAHKRVEKMRIASSNAKPQTQATIDEHDEERENIGQDPQEDFSSSRPAPQGEQQPLTAYPEPMVRDYGGSLGSPSTTQMGNGRRSFVSRLIPGRNRSKTPSRKFLLPVDIISEDAALHGLSTIRKPKVPEDDPDAVEDNEGEYLKSKLWWLGFLLMNVGEMGNFISYAFAPASVVAPLGTFALMANCFFSPLLLREHFRTRDLLGVVIAVIGAVTVVLASNASDTQLDPEALLHAISQTAFIVYACVYAVGAVILGTLSEGSIGKNYVFVDVGLCALFGGFTVLSTKALSTLLTLKWIEIFTLWITYPLIAVLILTGVGQIRYLNRALMRFDSKVVIPSQFVLFTLSAITGSAILYGDFRKARFHQVVTFLYGCAATFSGVFIIAWSPKDSNGPDGEDIPEERDEARTDPVQAGSEGAQLGMGTLGRRRRATLVLPSGVSGPKDSPTLRHKQSSLATMGISPAQHLLLVHTPPREIPRERLDSDSDVESPNSYGRRRTMSWYGHEGQRDRGGNGTRDSSISGRLRGGGPRVGSSDAQSNIPR